MIPFWIYMPMAWPFVLRSRHQAFFLRKCWGYLPMLNDPTCFKQVYIVCGYTCVRSGIDTLTYLICHIYTFSEYDKNSTQSPASSQNRAFPGKLRRNKTMIKILFICHGNMPKWYGNVNIHGMMRWTLWENTPFLHLLISLKAEHSYDLNILFKNTSIKRCVFLLLFESRGELDAKNQITR